MILIRLVRLISDRADNAEWRNFASNFGKYFVKFTTMSKRPFDDNAVATIFPQVLKSNGRKKKKRKVDESPPSTIGSATDESRSGQQPKESRRLRKSENISSPLSLGREQGNKNLLIRGREAQKVKVQGEKRGLKAATKAARKAERARTRASKNEGNNGENATSIQALQPAGSGNANCTSQQLSRSISKKSKKKPSYIEDPNLTALPTSEIDFFLRANFIAVTDPTSSAPLRPIIDFSHLPKTNVTGKSPFATFKSPTPIQAAAWPFLLSGRDVIGIAETGSGKTLAFGIPCIRSISASVRSSIPPRAVASAVIVSPTRELAVQIHTQILPLADSAGLSTACVYGGVPKDPQRLALATAQIIVATPGRLNDLISDGDADLSKVNYLVLDEADRMLDKGFEPEIRKIIACTPSSSSGRQTLMFTATWPPSVRALASTFMNSPVHISIGKDNPTGELRANTSITQKVEVVSPQDKEARLLQLVKMHQSGRAARDRVLVFCLYKKEAVRVENFLRMRGRQVVAIHGDMNQGARTKSLEAFRQGECPLLVATDVAARGLDIPEVKLVLNMTFPLTVEDYVHRIGR